ncbi:MAG: hypothetical protein KatS3mg076_3161 [Candidatus Binatia bacterium]|nr:MAG: hypothetical protein KatS3mg076_3161 [Candidatus Binatia bacterium]
MSFVGRSRGGPILVVLASLLLPTPSRADDDWALLAREGVELLRASLRIDTTNPPGNETPLANFLASWFRQRGVEAEVFESEPGRGSVLARLPGRNRGRAVVLLNHLDVVPAEADQWSRPPFGGSEDQGYLYGRGAIDCKGMGAVQAMALVALARSEERPGRDVVFLGTADEETGGAKGAGWFVREHAAELGSPEFVLNEGGAIRDFGRKRVYEVAVAEKAPLWIRLVARGEGGHGSTPRNGSAVTRLVRALERIRRYRPDVRLTPEVRRYYRALAAFVDEQRASLYRDLEKTLSDERLRNAFLAEPRDAALVRNTLAPTVLRAGQKTNVIPTEARAEIDCRLLPGEDPEAFLRTLRSVVDDESVEFEILLHFPPSSSPTETSLYRAIERVAGEEGAGVVPAVLRGFTDSHYFREIGAVAYGFVPVTLDEEESRRVHGVDERLSRENLVSGAKKLVRILRELDRLERSEKEAR